LPLSAQREEAVAIDGQVQAVAGVVDVALGELLGDGGGAYAGAGNLAAGAENGGRVDVGELGARTLEAGGGDVGDVVAGNGEVLVGRSQTAQSDVERHGETPFRNRLLADGQYAGERQTPHASQVQMHFATRQGDAVDGGGQVGGQRDRLTIDLRFGDEGVVAGLDLLVLVVDAIPDEVDGTGAPVPHGHGLHQSTLVVVDLHIQVAAIGRHHHVAGHALAGVHQRLAGLHDDRATDQRGGLQRLGRLVAAHEGLHRRVQVVHAFQAGELRELGNELGVVLRVQRVLVFHLGNQQLQEGILAQG